MINKDEIKDMIIGFLKTICSVSPGLEKILRELLLIQAVPRKYRFLNSGDVSDRVYFITSGLVRAYYFDEDEEDDDDETKCGKTSWVMKEGDVFVGVRSFFTRKPGTEYIETLEKTIVGSISHAELEMLYRKFRSFNWIGRILNQQYNVLAATRADELRSNDASKRYQVFMENYPELAKRLPTKYIASYIGVEGETLYRIKNGNYNYPKKQ